MIQKIIKVGTSLAVTIPKRIAKELNFKPGNEVFFEADAKKHMISYSVIKENKVTERQQKVAGIALDFIDKYKEDFEALKNK